MGDLYLADHGSRIDGSHGFSIPRLYETYHRFLMSFWIYLCVCVCLLCICDILWLISTFPRHGLDWYSLQHFSHISLSSWLMSSSTPLQDENLQWRPDNIIPTQRTTQLAISQLQSRVAILLFLCREGDTAPAQNNGLPTLDWSWGKANWVIRCMSIILSGLYYYRFSSCRGVNEDINHDAG